MASRRLSASVPLDGCPVPVEVILYVGSESAHSEVAIENIKRVVRDLPSPRVTLTIRDPKNHSNDEVEINRLPGPRTFIVGHIMSADLLLELLGECA